MAKLADAPDLGSGAFGVGVRVPSPAPLENRSSNRCSFFIGINMLNIEDVKINKSGKIKSYLIVTQPVYNLY